jgi:hypothetical protein
MKKLILLSLLATVYFTGNAQSCTCNVANQWDKLTAYINSKPKIIICGSTFNLVKEQQFALEGGYKCEGNCNTKFSAVLANTETNSIVETYQHFEFTWLYKFYKPGKYKLVITADCKGKKCTECIFYFKVR